VKRLAILFLTCGAHAVANASDCRPAKVRQKSRTVVVDSTAVFAIPVATVVVVSPPVLLYSYRAAAKAVATPTMKEATGARPATPIDAEQLLRFNCLKCHQGDASKSGLPFFDLSGALITPLPRRAILEAASPNVDGVTHMPPGEAQKLTPEELEVLSAWAEPPRDLRY
jgi:hypothetical protein